MSLTSPLIEQALAQIASFVGQFWPSMSFLARTSPLLRMLGSCLRKRFRDQRPENLGIDVREVFYV